ncbi:hypothetical protein RYX36_029362 [Vicia faba]
MASSKHLFLFLISILFLLTLSSAEVAFVPYNFEVSYITASPLGVPQQVIAINDQFPGPTINVTTNNNVAVNVRNKLDESLLIHWSGMQQRRRIHIQNTLTHQLSTASAPTMYSQNLIPSESDAHATSAPSGRAPSSTRHQNMTSHASYHHHSSVPLEDAFVPYNFEVSYITASPLGVPQQVIAINDQFPGPTINVTTNNNVAVNVRNKLDESLLIHWSGMQQRRRIHIQLLICVNKYEVIQSTASE